MSMTESSSEYFRRVAGNWDEISAGYFGQAVREAALAKAYLRPEMAVADIGAGTGFMAAGLAPRVRRVYVVDGSAAMLEVAKKNLGRFSNIEYHEADGASLPFPDESLDAVFANMYLHHTIDPLAAIREMARVLRPGGRLVITDLDEHPYTWLKDEMADVWQGFVRDQVRAWLREAGLVNVIVDCTGQSCCAESSDPGLRDEQGREVKIGVFVASGARRMARRDAVQDSYTAVAQSGPSCECGSSTPGKDGGACCSSASSGGSGCCGESERVDEPLGYSQAELSAAPEEAADFSLGCGNPIAMSGLKPGEVVLDIGSGGGLDAFLAADRVGPAGRVIGVDMTPAMLERARASAERNQISNVEFRQGYAEELPAADGEVDVILSNCVINLTEDKGCVFQEAFRALKPGGRLEVSDVVASGAAPLELLENASSWAACVAGALPEQEYLHLVSQAGFQNVTVRRSPVMNEVQGVLFYSAIVSAQKPAAFAAPGDLRNPEGS